MIMLEKRVYGAIDIGSNAVRLLIKREAEATPGAGAGAGAGSEGSETTLPLVRVLFLRVPLRLGLDVFTTGRVSKENGVKLRRLIKGFRQFMKIYEVTSYRACATSAMRDSTNGNSIIKKIRRDTDIDIEIISGVEEARLIYNNNLESLEDKRGNYIFVDVGGGSTEISLWVNGILVESLSYNIGTVRMLSGAVTKESWDSMRSDLTRLEESFGEINIIGSGGNINKLYRIANKKSKRNLRLPISSLREIYEELSPLSVEERMKRYYLKEDRADVIVPAAEIFLFIADIVKAHYIHVPVIGLADGIIDALYAEDIARESQK